MGLTKGFLTALGAGADRRVSNRVFAELAGGGGAPDRPAIGDTASTLLASGLTAVLHQIFMVHSVPSRLYVTESGNLGELGRALVRKRHIGQIMTFVDQQEARRNLAARGER